MTQTAATYTETAGSSATAHVVAGPQSFNPATTATAKIINHTGAHPKPTITLTAPSVPFTEIPAPTPFTITKAAYITANRHG